MDQIVYLNGTFLPMREAKIPPADAGFLYGYGLFETMRIYQGEIFRIDAHLSRLFKSAEILAIQLEYSRDELQDACKKLIQMNGLIDGRLRLTVSAGPSGLTPTSIAGKEATVFITASKELIVPTHSRYEAGYSAITTGIIRDSNSPLSRIKSINYLHNLLAKREATAAGADEAVFLNEKGYLTEGTSTNIFLVKEGILLTPPVNAGVLPGITREVVLAICETINIKTSEAGILPEDLILADEAFLTNSIIEIMPLTSFNSKVIGNPDTYKITRLLMKAYTELVAAETGK